LAGGNWLGWFGSKLKWLGADSNLKEFEMDGGMAGAGCFSRSSSPASSSQLNRLFIFECFQVIEYTFKLVSFLLIQLSRILMTRNDSGTLVAYKTFPKRKYSISQIEFDLIMSINISKQSKPSHGV